MVNIDDIRKYEIKKRRNRKKKKNDKKMDDEKPKEPVALGHISR